MASDLHNKHKRHRNVLYGAVSVLLVLQVVSWTFVSLQLIQLSNKVDSEMENLEDSFLEKIGEYNLVYQAEFDSISKKLNEQEAEQASFKQEINLLQASQEDFSGIIEGSVAGVVSVLTNRGLGTGFIVSKDRVVTNYHVIEGASEIDVVTSDRNKIAGTLIGISQVRDLALVEVDLSGENYKELELADSDSLLVGKQVIAIGNPLGLSFSVSEGIISALERVGPNGLAEYIQTDVPLNPGNSGGPLINTEGLVVGINNFKISETEGLGFALESDAVEEFVSDINRQIEEANQ
tara:strand:+ start:230 stop:1108 length:879 start_codon:yes stop_codon:yes gene_type:complete